MSVNKVILVGRLGQNPEVKYTPSGAAVANFSIATNESWNDKAGQKQERTEWHRIVAWGKTAELCAQYLSKGRQVYLEGRLQTRQWQDKDGQTKYTTEVHAQTVQFLGAGANTEAGASGASNYGGAPAGGYGGSPSGGYGGGPSSGGYGSGARANSAGGSFGSGGAGPAGGFGAQPDSIPAVDPHVGRAFIHRRRYSVLMRSLIVIPTYNEIDNLRPLVSAILEVCPQAVELLVVDDGSPDGTGDLADALATENPRVHVLHREKKMGLGTAYVAGFGWGLERGFDSLIEMDADFSHHPKYLPRMLELLATKDVVIGSRYVPGGGTLNWGLGRKLLSRGGGVYSRLILGAPIRDFTGGFNGWRRSVLQNVDLPTLRSDGYSFQIELKYRAYLNGAQIQEFPIIFEDRKVGKSKMNRRIVLEALSRIWSFRFRSAPGAKML